MADIFSKRAHASESSWGREEDKARMARLRKFLEKHGYEAPPPKAATKGSSPTVDVLAEISAHSRRARAPPPSAPEATVRFVTGASAPTRRRRGARSKPERWGGPKGSGKFKAR